MNGVRFLVGAKDADIDFHDQIQTPIQCVNVDVYAGIKQLEREANQSPQFNA